jgi:hypothetical protein
MPKPNIDDPLKILISMPQLQGNLSRVGMGINRRYTFSNSLIKYQDSTIGELSIRDTKLSIRDTNNLKWHFCFVNMHPLSIGNI